MNAISPTVDGAAGPALAESRMAELLRGLAPLEG
jgi:hypothetical protein